MPSPRSLVARDDQHSNADATLPVRRGGALIADPRSRALTEGRRPGSDFQRLVHNVEALRVPQRLGGVVQMVAACPGDGVSTVAAEYACTDARERGEPVLLLDCNVLASDAARPPRRARVGAYEAFHAGSNDFTALAVEKPDFPGVLWAALAGSALSLIGDGQTRMSAFLAAARSQFALTVLDCPPVLDYPQSATMSRLCDGTLLVVRAGRTVAEDVRAAQQQIEDQGGQILGVVFNRRQRYLPRFLNPRG